MPVYELTGEVWPYPGKGGWQRIEDGDSTTILIELNE
jgi:hypothetical protein